MGGVATLEDPPKKSYKCHPTLLVEAVDCIICENCFNKSYFDRYIDTKYNLATLCFKQVVV